MKRWKMNSEVAGLRSLTKNGRDEISRLVVMKPLILGFGGGTTKGKDYSYLVSCHLCHNPLPLGKEVYMYRGDLGFCSVECRDRQIYLEEMEELQLHLLSSFHKHKQNPSSFLKPSPAPTPPPCIFS